MGGRGASRGVSNKGKPYGTEYETVLPAGRVKFVQKIDDRENKKKPQSTTAPMETMTKGRVYATVNENGQLSSVTFYREGKRTAQIDLLKPHNDLGVPHTHKGYKHDENGTRKSNMAEKILVAKLRRIWYGKQQE